MSTQTCLVTGVAGFIGSHLAQRLLNEGYSVIGVDCFTDYYPREVKERNLHDFRSHERFSFIEADLTDLDLRPLLRGGAPEEGGDLFSGNKAVDYVFHLAAQPGVRASWGENFAFYSRNNILATQRLLEAAKETPLKKFVYSSSSSVYGNAETFPTPETLRPQPISPYGVTKLAGEHLCMLYGHNYDLPVVSLRYFTVYGPKQRPDMAFHRFLLATLKDEEIIVHGDGEQTRDFTFVDDAVEGNLLAALSDVVGEIFNIGGGSQVTLNQVIGNLETLFQRQAKLRYIGTQKGDARDTAADIRKAESMLGYEPQVTLLEGLARQLTWLRQNMAESIEGK